MEWHSEQLAGCELAWSAGSITMSGEIDAADAPMIENVLRTLLGAGSFVVDCRAVTFIDVAGLRMIAQVGVAATAVGAVVGLHCSPAVTETLNLCGLHELPGLVLTRDDHDSAGSSP
jgi:anti-anti-sigma factor